MVYLASRYRPCVDEVVLQGWAPKRAVLPLFCAAFKMSEHSVSALLSAARHIPHLGEVQSFVFKKYYKTWKKTIIHESAD